MSNTDLLNLKPVPTIFLDIDGVLNGHEKMSNHYSRMLPHCIENLNHVLRTIPDARIVVSSSWRYLALHGSMNLLGLENLFLSHGLDCYGGKIVGWTESDEDTAESMGRPAHGFTAFGEYDITAWHSWVKEHGFAIRREQIYRYASERPEVRPFVVLDDIDLQMPELIKTDGDEGLTWAHVGEIINRLAARPSVA